MINTMIIEDDPMVREINSKFLLKVGGFNLCKAVRSLTEAKEYLKVNKLELILLDIYLPKENGLDFLRWLRNENIKIDVILITADKSTEAVKEAFRFGAVDYLIKPFTFERFRDSLLEFNERHINLEYSGEIEQIELDRFIKGNMIEDNSKHGDNNLIKGLSNHTYEKIIEKIDEWKDEYFSAEELSESLGMARVTVRKYLEYMEIEGKIELLIEYGKVGRPQHKYKVKS